MMSIDERDRSFLVKHPVDLSNYTHETACFYLASVIHYDHHFWFPTQMVFSSQLRCAASSSTGHEPKHIHSQVVLREIPQAAARGSGGCLLFPAIPKAGTVRCEKLQGLRGRGLDA